MVVSTLAFRFQSRSPRVEVSATNRSASTVRKYSKQHEGCKPALRAAATGLATEPRRHRVTSSLCVSWLKIGFVAPVRFVLFCDLCRSCVSVMDQDAIAKGNALPFRYE